MSTKFTFSTQLIILKFVSIIFCDCFNRDNTKNTEGQGS